MSTSSLWSRAELLLREAAHRGVRSFHLKANGEGVDLLLRMRGSFERGERILLGWTDLLAEFDALAPHKRFEDEFEWEARISLSVEEREVFFDLWCFSDKGKKSFIVYVLDPKFWFSFDKLGLSQRDAKTLDELISFRSGVVVGCGCNGSGHAATQSALLERLGQQKRRVVSLYDWSHPQPSGVTQIELDHENLKEQIAALSADFDVFALPNLYKPEIFRSVFDLAASGHLVVGLIYSYPVEVAACRFVGSGISPDELREHFLGGWSQTMVPRGENQGLIPLFDCMSREEARHLIFEQEWLNARSNSDEEARARWRDAEEKIAAGLTTRELVDKVLSYWCPQPA